MESRQDEIVALDHARVTYERQPAIDDVNISIRRGEVVALLGANGSGKTTVIRSSLGLVDVDHGEARLFGTPLKRFHQWQRVGYVPQRLGAGSGVPATVTEVVASGRLTRKKLFNGRADRKAIAEALDAVGLADRAREPVSTLSGGQQQRVLIARALAGEPELLVLDEPTVGVDAASQQALAAALLDRIRTGITMLLVTHEMGVLAPLITRTITMHDGHVAYDGAPHGFEPGDLAGRADAHCERGDLEQPPPIDEHPHAPGVTANMWGEK
ncbi:MAG: metal ABC transporter ATP-binding protein [Corynebacteriales bacterium]|nr:metal ABC transporter ATP-binding protein [Mycobacteriales bacterium]